MAPEAGIVDQEVPSSAGHTRVGRQPRTATAGGVTELAVVWERPAPELICCAGSTTETGAYGRVVGHQRVGLQNVVCFASGAIVCGRADASRAELVTDVASRSVEEAAWRTTAS